MAEHHSGQPVDAHVNPRVALAAAGQVGQVTAARGAGADEDGVVVLGQQRLETPHPVVETGVHAHVEDGLHLAHEHRLGQAERGQLAAHEAAALLLVVVEVDRVAERQQVAGHGERGRATADEGDALAVFLRRHRRHKGQVRVAVVGAEPFQPADGHRLPLHPAAPAGRLAGPVADPAEHPGKDVGHPVEPVGLVITFFADQADVLRHRGVGRAGVLAVDHLVEVFRVVGIGRLHGETPGWQGTRARGKHSCSPRIENICGEEKAFFSAASGPRGSALPTRRIDCA